MTERYIEKILKARVYDVARETPLDRAPILSRRLGNEVLLKRDVDYIVRDGKVELVDEFD